MRYIFLPQKFEPKPEQPLLQCCWKMSQSGYLSSIILELATAVSHRLW